MGEAADDMWDQWEDFEMRKTVCPKHGEYAEYGFGCPACEIEAEDNATPQTEGESYE